MVAPAWLFVVVDGNAEYIVPVDEFIGADGETCIKIVVEQGTPNIVTAYPI